jgi:hypothetical protein
MYTTGSSFTLTPKTHDAVAGGAVPPQTTAPAAKHHFTFGDFIDIINPLQHLPVIGTVYRALTGDKIDTPEKLVGDTLYGGPLGLASSLADLAFEKTTGKNFGDTVLGLFTGHRDAKPTAVAQARTSAPAVPAQVASAPAVAQEQALTASLQRNGTDPETAQRALFAYRRAFGGTPSFAASY